MSKRNKPKSEALPAADTAPPKATKTRLTPWLVDIIVPLYGEWSMAEQAIASIPAACEGMDDPYRVIVVDNGTPVWHDSAGTAIHPEEQARGLKGKLRKEDLFVRIDTNMGYPGALNHGVARGTSPLIVVLTADVIAGQGSITNAVRTLDDSNVGVVGALLTFPTDESPNGPPGKVQHAGLAFNMKGDPYHIFIGWTPTNGRVNQRRNMQAVTGAFFATRRELWVKVGGMDAVYGAGTFEDVDYCFKVRSTAQKEIVFEPGMRGTHYVGGSQKKGAGRQGFNLSLNQTVFRGRWARALQWDEWRWL
jgi:GT2 family glycosyltransferase